VKIDFYSLRTNGAQRPEPDLEHELVREDAVTRAQGGETVLVKVWLRTEGPAQLAALEETLAAALTPLGLR
jgi:hypothetical protein